MIAEIDLSNPHAVAKRLAELEYDLAIRQNAYENAAAKWQAAKREVEREKARALLASDQKSVTEKKAEGDLAAYSVEGAEYEAEFEATRSVLKVIEMRVGACQSILKSQGRV